MKSIGEKINGKKIVSVGYLDGTKLFYELEDKTIVLDEKLIKFKKDIDFE